MNTHSTIVRAFTAGMLAAAVLLGAHANRPAAWADETAQAQVSKINQSLAGARTGIVTQASGSLVQIDDTNYVLAAQAVLEDVQGNPLEPGDLIYAGGAVSVQFWLGTGPADKQITQMLVTFPR
jgi:hypothetical protein